MQLKNKVLILVTFLIGIIFISKTYCYSAVNREEDTPSAWLGIEITKEPNLGVGGIVNRVIENSPASKMGIQEGDTITSISCALKVKYIISPQDLVSFIQGLKPGDKITLWIIRNHVPFSVSGVLEEKINEEATIKTTSPALDSSHKLPEPTLCWSAPREYENEEFKISYGYLTRITPVLWNYLSKLPLYLSQRKTDAGEKPKYGLPAEIWNFILLNLPSQLQQTIFSSNLKSGMDVKFEDILGIVWFMVENKTSDTKILKFNVEMEDYSFPEIKQIELKPKSFKIFSLTPILNNKVKNNRELLVIPYFIEVMDLKANKLLIEESYKTTLGARGDAILSLTPYSLYTYLIASWVTPNDLLIDKILSIAKEKRADRTIYSENIYSQMKTLFYTLRENMGISYVGTTLTMFEYENFDQKAIFQRIKFPSESVRLKMANCIDGAVLYASLFEAIGLEPVIVLVPGHAFVGVKTSPLSNQYYFLETTLTGKGWGLQENLNRLAKWLITAENDFDTAVKTAGKEFNYWSRQNKVEIIDIKSCREFGIYPYQVTE